jgi:hypothetical protein
MEALAVPLSIVGWCVLGLLSLTAKPRWRGVVQAAVCAVLAFKMPAMLRLSIELNEGTLPLESCILPLLAPWLLALGRGLVLLDTWRRTRQAT